MPNVHSTIEMAETIVYLKNEILMRDEMIEERDKKLYDAEQRINELEGVANNGPTESHVH